MLGCSIEQLDGPGTNFRGTPLNNLRRGQILPLQAAPTVSGFKQPKLAELPEYPLRRKYFLPAAPCRLITRGTRLY